VGTNFIRSITRATVALLLTSLLLLPARGWPQALPPGLQEVPLEGQADASVTAVAAVGAVAPPGCEKKSLVFSPDRRRVACVGQNDGKPAALLDGVLGPGYDELNPLYVTSTPDPLLYSVAYSRRTDYGFTFSLDSRHFTYAARQGRTWRLVLDGLEQASYDAVFGPEFSPDSQRLAYRAREGKNWFVVLDGARRPGDFQVLKSPVFSADSKRVAYVGCAAVTCGAIIDDKEKGYFSAVGQVGFSQDSQHFVFSAARAEMGRYKMFVVTDQQTWEFTAGALSDTITWTTDLRSAESNLLAEHLPSVIFSPDGKHLAWVELGKLVRDGNPGPACEKIAAAEFSADGNHSAVICESKLKMSLLVDDQVLREFDPQVEYPHFPTFSPDGQRFAYVIARPLESAGQKGKRLGLGSMNVGPGGTVSTHIVNSVEAVLMPLNQRHGVHLIVDGNEVAQSVAIGLGPMTFSPDGRRLVYHLFGPRGTQEHVVVLDGREGKLYDEIGEISFVDNNTISYIAREGSKRFKVTHTVP
jgi:Tol biopolymer transport system component